MIKKLLVLVLAVIQTACAYPTSVPVLTYHRVSPDNIAPSREDVQITRFEEHLKMIKDHGYTTLTVTELAILIKSKQPMPQRAVVLTFDDGWRSSIEAQRLLAKYGHKGTFYIISGMFENPAYINKDELRMLAAKSNVEIGSHTHTHFLQWIDTLAGMDPNVVLDEMKKSKAIIEGIINKPVQTLAWPFGHVHVEARKHAAAIGYTSLGEINAFSYNDASISPFQLQRLNVDGNCTVIQIKKMIDTGVLDKCK